jgi:hypothetical protein
MNTKAKDEVSTATISSGAPKPIDETTNQAEAPYDPLDLANLRLNQNFIETAGVKKLLTTVPVRKPNRQDFIRVHPDPEYRSALALIEIKEDREMYVVHSRIAQEFPEEFFSAMVYTAINRQKVLFLWPTRLPGEDGRTNNWHQSAQTAAEYAMKGWVRVKANMSLGAYEIGEAAADIPDPVWPDISFNDLLRIGFRGRVVDSLDHPVLKRLRGE